MGFKRRKRVTFLARKKTTVPVKVNFKTSSGEKVSFKARRPLTKRVRVSFLTKRKKRKW